MKGVVQVLSDEQVKEIIEKKGIKKDQYRIIKYLDEIKDSAKKNGNILNRDIIIKIIKEFKESKKIRKSTTISQFLKYVVEVSNLFTEIAILSEYNENIIIRYVATYVSVSPYEIALSLLSKSFLSHYSALYANELTLNNPKDIYINKEQSKKNIPDNGAKIVQNRIDYAFSKKMRSTNMIYSFKYKGMAYKVHVLNSKNTKNTGIVSRKIVGFSKSVHITNIERTLIDTTVRPGYSGGAQEVMAAYIRAKNVVDIKKLEKYLINFNYSYPYYKSVAFYMKHAKYEYKDFLEKNSKSRPEQSLLNFYLDYRLIGRSFDEEIGIFYPKSIEQYSLLPYF